MLVKIVKYDDTLYQFTCKHCFFDERNHTFNIPGEGGMYSIGFEQLKRVELKNVEELEELKHEWE